MDENKPDFLTLLRDMLDDHLGKKEFTDAFAKVVETIKELRKTNEDEFNAIRETVNLLGQKLSLDNSTDLSSFKDEARSILTAAQSVNEKRLTEKIAELEIRVDDKLATVMNGEDADEERVTAAVIERVRKPITDDLALRLPELGASIRDGLELLEGEDRLDAKAIKNLPEAVREIHHGGATALWNLGDVDIAGIQVGQAIKWDGTRWIAFTPAGANTSVYGETPTDSGDHTDFTLAHTPVAGTLRLYRGGAYQKSGDDYTLSGDTITLSVALATGEVLQADYEYA